MARIKRDPRLELPPLELECMKALWALGEGTVNGVRERLLSARPLAYTTVMTILSRLAQKGAAERIKRHRAYYYRPAVSENQVRRRAIHRLLAEHFEGSEKALRAYLNLEAAAPEKIGLPKAPARPPAAELGRTGPAAAEPEAPTEGVIDEALL